MAVIYVDEIFSTGLDTDVDDKGRISASAVRVFNVFTSTATDDDLAVKFDPRLPVEKSRHPLFTLLYCHSVRLKRNGPLHWEATANYKSPAYRDPGNDPTFQPTEIDTFTVTNEEPIDEDVNGKPISTANGERFYGVSRPISDLGIRLNKKFRFFDPSSFYTYIDCVNSDTFLGFAPGILRIVQINASDEWIDETPYYNVTVEIHARKPYRTTPQKAWYKRIRHEGFYIKQFGKVLRAKDGSGKDMVEPVMLNDDGTKLADQTQAKWLEFQVFETVNFGSMGF